MQHPRAFLWIPENCKKVRGIVFTQHNMIEEGMLENSYFRKIMTEIGFAEIWVTPNISINYDISKKEDEVFNDVLKTLADVSGYRELSFAPIVPLGHSALASFPWNFAAFNPERTLALVSVHGDAPQTNLTGSGRPNPDWANRNIDGIPSLFIMGEYEWLEKRILPAYNYIEKHPQSVITLFCDAGHGHFDYSEMMVKFAADYIKKAAVLRLPKIRKDSADFVKMKKINPESGWLMDKWRHDSIAKYKPGSFKDFEGDRKTASWVFDKKTAEEAERFYAQARGRINQFIGYKQNGRVLIPEKTHANYYLDFKPSADGITFHVSAFFADSTRVKTVGKHAATPLKIDRICGPIKKLNDTTFQISFYRMGLNSPRRSNDIWLLAHNQGDKNYKSIVQQSELKFPLVNKEGRTQEINFAPISDVRQHSGSIELKASSSAAVPVGLYVKEGPAYLDGTTLHFTKIPLKAKFPVKVTVTAWQYGIAGELQSAAAVERSFYITK